MLKRKLYVCISRNVRLRRSSGTLFTSLESLKFDTRAEEAVKTFWERGIFGICPVHI